MCIRDRASGCNSGGHSESDQVAQPANHDYNTTLNEMYQIDVSDNEMLSGQDAIPFGCEEFFEAQRGERSLGVYFARAAAGSGEFKVIRGLLYRKQSDRINSLEQYALAVPLKYRKQLLFLAHDHPCSLSLIHI